MRVQAKNILYFCVYRGDTLLYSYTNVAFENIGFRVFSERFRLRERGISRLL